MFVIRANCTLSERVERRDAKSRVKDRRGEGRRASRGAIKCRRRWSGTIRRNSTKLHGFNDDSSREAFARLSER